MTDDASVGASEISLSTVLRDSITAANRSWSETDKTYVSVCSALVAAFALLSGRDSGVLDYARGLVGLLVLLLTLNWMSLIRRYRQDIISMLKRLAGLHARSPLGEHFKDEALRVAADRRDYRVALILFLLSLLLTASPVAEAWLSGS